MLSLFTPFSVLVSLPRLSPSLPSLVTSPRPSLAVVPASPSPPLASSPTLASSLSGHGRHIRMPKIQPVYSIVQAATSVNPTDAHLTLRLARTLISPLPSSLPLQFEPLQTFYPGARKFASSQKRPDGIISTLPRLPKPKIAEHGSQKHTGTPTHRHTE
ncbi:hypothetical protein COCCADRAFT_30010 [Bipolaris zeicola 26-R-13]|uniref:Uncharacterized protein n=1 Tax=Cochliobolus carbonum (strain 26-R-13) TaxID=930089 RepID=W6XNA7_COCC2|nr:uncharacterized protein COCCADRAFT_30010 [Bipolaris zeicola 26-R-13]EUC28802.1 hypothetical protein COCCADRAFT_30010 [Bipolaris zeicola 26-R-13]